MGGHSVRTVTGRQGHPLETRDRRRAPPARASVPCRAPGPRKHGAAPVGWDPETQRGPRRRSRDLSVFHWGASGPSGFRLLSDSSDFPTTTKGKGIPLHEQGWRGPSMRPKPLLIYTVSRSGASLRRSDPGISSPLRRCLPITAGIRWVSDGCERRTRTERGEQDAVPRRSGRPLDDDGELPTRLPLSARIGRPSGSIVSMATGPSGGNAEVRA